MLPTFPDPFTLPSTASNEWAVDGRHTASGAPLLAGDPHLAFGLPGDLVSGAHRHAARRARGGDGAGCPFLVLGHNAHIAWTFTTTGSDVQDLFVETPAGADYYLTPDGPRPFVVREERIRVRGQPDELWTVRETRHGPLISDLTSPNGPLLAVSMANLMPGDTAAAGLMALNEATDVACGGARRGADHFAEPEPHRRGPRGHRAVRHRARADPPRRRRQPPGRGRGWGA